MRNENDEKEDISKTTSRITKISFQAEHSVDTITNALENLEFPNRDMLNDKTISSLENELDVSLKPCDNKPDKKITGILKKENYIPHVEELEGMKSAKVFDKKIGQKKCSEVHEISDKKPTKQEQDISPLMKVENSFSEWYTIDTLRRIKGDDFVRQLLRENGCTVSNVEAATGITPNESNMKMTLEFREKYIQLCRKLDLQDLQVNFYVILNLGHSCRYFS